MNAHRMFTRRPRVGLLAALAAGLLAQQVGAAEGVMVVLAPAATELQAEPTAIRTELSEYVRSVNEEIRISLESSFKQRPAPQLQLALSEASTRG